MNEDTQKTTVESLAVVTNKPAPPALAIKRPRMGDSGNIVEVLQSHFGMDGGRMHTGAEIGTHRGETSAKLLRAFPGLMLWLIDPYKSYKPTDAYYQSGDSLSRLTREQQFQHYLAAKAVTEFAADRRMFLRFPSVEAVKIMSTPKLSWVFLDGAHHYEAVRDDIAAWWPKVEAGGVLAGHDYSHPRDGKQFGVKQAVTEFAESAGLEVGLRGSVWFCVKK